VLYNEPLGAPYVTVTLGTLVVNGDTFNGLPLKYAVVGASHIYMVAFATGAMLNVAVVPAHTLVGIPVNGTITDAEVGVVLVYVRLADIWDVHPLSSCTITVVLPVGRLVITPLLFCVANRSAE
jgi:hypothetical protein